VGDVVCEVRRGPAGAKKRKGKAWASEITLVHAASTQFSGKRTDKQGGYLVSLPKPAFAGTYHAEVTQQKIRALRARQTCRAARSATVAV
jgi:hypothetical protein